MFKGLCARTVFLSTLRISERQIHTVIGKIQPNGLLEEERWGKKFAKRDAHLKREVEAHINRFPRVESHYCRVNSMCDYLPADLNKSIMYNMFIRAHPNGCSYLVYSKTLQRLNLKFHQPPNDKCGLCESYLIGTYEKKEELRSENRRHVLEKCSRRILFESSKLQQKI